MRRRGLLLVRVLMRRDGLLIGILLGRDPLMAVLRVADRTARAACLVLVTSQQLHGQEHEKTDNDQGNETEDSKKKHLLLVCFWSAFSFSAA